MGQADHEEEATVNILALDLATKTGWCLQEDGRVESGVQLFDVKRGESPGMRYVRFRRWLEEVGARAEIIVYEQTVSSPGRIAVEIADGFATRIQEYCAVRGIEHAAVYPATLKKFVTGKGNAKKPAMQEHARAHGWLEAMTTGDDNEIDARCLLHYALAEIVPAGVGK
jgi:crossover junction endodeoxyribonuclease RuvC